MTADTVLAQAIQSLRGGDRATATTLLQQVTQTAPEQPDGWLWLAAASEDPALKRDYLRRVLKLNPAEQRAFAALRALGDDPAALVAPQPSTTQSRSADLAAAGPLPQIRFAATGAQAQRIEPWQLAAFGFALVAVLLVVLTVLVLP